MADTETSFLSLVLQTIGGNRNTWGGILNANLTLLDSARAGRHAISTTGGTTTPNDTQYIKPIIDVSGTLSSNAIIVLPNLSGWWIVNNGTTGAYTLSAKTASGSAVVLEQSKFSLIFCNGSDVVSNALTVANVSFAMLAAALIASQGNAQAMTASTVLMTPQRTWDSIWAFKGYYINVIDKDLLTPAALTPSEGDRYFVNGTGSGGWTGYGSTLVEYRGAAWVSFAPVTEQRIVVRDEKLIYRWTGSALVVDLPRFPVLAPAQITANQNDYAPTGRTSSGALVLDLDAARSLTGIVPNFDGEILTIINTSAFSLTLTDASASSSAANRFSFGADAIILAGKSATLIYQVGAVSRWRLMVAPTAATPPQPASSVVNLRIDNNSGTPNTKLDIAADEVTLVDTSGNAIKHTAVAETIDSTATGVNGCDAGSRAADTDYFIWLISNGTLCKGILHKDDTTAPTMPTGYTYKKRVGWQRTNGSSNFKRIRQRGAWAHYVVVAGSPTANLPIMDSGSKGSISVPTWVAVALATYVPSTAAEIKIALGSNGSSGVAMAAPNNAYDTYNSNSNPPPVVNSSNNAVAAVSQGILGIESSSIYWANNDADAFIAAVGWRDNVC